MPPPHPTSRTRLPPNPPNTRRKYSTRTAFSSCSPANGPASLHHTPGTRSTRRSYFSGSERPPRRGSWSDMAMKSTAGRRLVEGGEVRVRFSRLYHFAARWALLPPFRPPPTSTHLHHPSEPPSAQAVASTFGNGGTSRNHSPASREFLSTSTTATRGCDLRPGNTTRPSLAGSGIGRVSRVRMSSGHVTTSTPWMQPPATSMTTNEPSPPSRSTVPLRPVAFPVPLQATERMSVSGSQR